jgi:hypothetical protein
MSLVNANVVVPVNAAVAANVLTDHSVTGANAVPNQAVTQHAHGTQKFRHAAPTVVSRGFRV